MKKRLADCGFWTHGQPWHTCDGREIEVDEPLSREQQLRLEALRHAVTRAENAADVVPLAAQFFAFLTWTKKRPRH